MADDKDKSGKDDPAKKEPEDVTGLKKALQEERDARQKLETQVAKLTTANTKAEEAKQAAEEAKKDELQKVQEQLATLQADAKRDAEDRLRLEVALEVAPEGLSAAKVRGLARRLSGSSKEELLEDAKELFADFAPSKNGDKDGKETGKDGKKDDFDPFTGRGNTPKEKLTPGAVPGAGADDSPEKIADEILKEKAF